MSAAEDNFKEAMAMAKKSQDNWARDILVLWLIILVPMVVASAVVCYRIAIN